MVKAEKPRKASKDKEEKAEKKVKKVKGDAKNGVTKKASKKKDATAAEVAVAQIADGKENTPSKRERDDVESKKAKKKAKVKADVSVEAPKSPEKKEVRRLAQRFRERIAFQIIMCLQQMFAKHLKCCQGVLCNWLYAGYLYGDLEMPPLCQPHRRPAGPTLQQPVTARAHCRNLKKIYLIALT